MIEIIRIRSFVHKIWSFIDQLKHLSNRGISSDSLNRLFSYLRPIAKKVKESNQKICLLSSKIFFFSRIHEI